MIPKQKSVLSRSEQTEHFDENVGLGLVFYVMSLLQIGMPETLN